MRASEIMRVAAFTGSRTISSARFRLRQYIAPLRPFGIDVDEFIAEFGSWPPQSKIIRPLWLAATLLQRVPSVIRSHAYDLTFLQREMVSTLATLERWTKRPRVLDLDDAVWTKSRGRHVEQIARLSQGVICGNRFIAEYVQQFQRNILLLPTGVDTARFVPLPAVRRKIIGWSGLAVALKWVYAIEDALATVLDRHPDAIFRIVSDKPPHFSRIPPSRVEYISWSPSIEVRAIQEMAVGLMPLEDSPLARGKCSYKMLLYMSCGVPVVVSPVGMNAEVLAFGQIGFGAVSDEEWIYALDWLLSNDQDALAFGRAGRAIVERHFSLRVLAPRLASFLHTCAGGAGELSAPAGVLS